MNLLIVNDEKMTADNLKEKINWEQYEIEKVYVAYDAESARICMEESYIDILLCDIEMPGENGIELLRWVREQKKDVECIFLTCHANFDYAQAAISLDCQDYVLIPARNEEIGKTVQKVVNRIKCRREENYYVEYGKSVLKKQLLGKEDPPVEKASKKEIVENVTAFIQANILDGKLSVEEISEKFHFHPVYLNRIFKEERGITISRYIIDERMKMAAAIMEQGEYSAFEIAQKVGYQRYNNFFNVFKQYYGVTPVQYREMHLKKEVHQTEQ